MLHHPQCACLKTLCIAALLLALPRTCLSQTESSDDYPLLNKGASEVSVRFTEFVVFSHPALLSTAGFRYGWVLTDPFGKGWGRGALEYTIDLLPAVVLTKPSTIYCGGIAPIGVRWNTLAKPRLRSYGEVEAGGVFCTANIPPSDLNIGFTVNTGAGLALFTRGNQMLTAGLNFSHLSDANLGNPNPNYNGISFVLEYHWLRSK